MTGNFTQYGIEIFFGKGLKRMTEIRRRRPYRNKSGGGKNGYLKSRGGQGETVTYLLRDVPTAVADQWCWSVGVSVGGI